MTVEIFEVMPRAEIEAQLAQNTNQFNSQFINVLYPPAPLNALKGNGQPENMANVQAIFDYINNIGGIIFFPSGSYNLTGTITVHDGTTVLGSGKNPNNGRPTYLNFAGNTGANASFYCTGASDINFKDFYLAGRSSGNGHEIFIDGYSRRINLDNIIVSTHTTGNGIHVPTSLITSTWKDIFVGGGYYGFNLAGATTSVTLLNCYANANTVGYYIGAVTYSSLISCAADSNSLYGYLIQNASQVGLYACGAESNTREAILLVGSNGIEISAFRSVANNGGASAFYPSFMDIQNSNQITISNCQDSSPNAATTYSLTSTTADSGSSILIVNPNFGKPINSRLLNVPRIDGCMYPGIIPAANAQNNSIFIDSADNKLKFKDNTGVITILAS